MPLFTDYYEGLAAGSLSDAAKIAYGASSNVDAALDSLLPDSLFIPAQLFTATLGATTIGAFGDAYSGWSMPDAAATSVGAFFAPEFLPPNWATYDVHAVWTRTGAESTGNLRFRFDHSVIAIVQDTAVPSITVGSGTTAAAPAQNTIAVTTVKSGQSVTAADTLQGLRFVRLGTDGADTFTGAIRFIGYRLVAATFS